MGKLSRDKGANFERWICKQIDEQLGFRPTRNLSQYQSKGQADIVIPCFSIEAKAYAKGYTHKPDWWRQAVDEAGDLEPVLIYKYDYQEPRAVVRLSLVNPSHKAECNTAQSNMVCTLSLDVLWYLMREKIAEQGMDEAKNI